MALRFMSGFDAITSTNDLFDMDNGPSWISGLTFNATGGVRGGGSLEATGSTGNALLWEELASPFRAIRFAGYFYWSGSAYSSSSPWLRVYRRNSAASVYDGTVVNITSSGEISAFRQDSTSQENVQTSSAVMAVDTWHYVEVYINSSSGVAQIRINGTEVLSATGIAMQGAFSAIIDGSSYSIGCRTGEFWDDLIIMDNSGTEFNDFLGVQLIETFYPDGAGDRTELTPLSGNNWENVDDPTSDGDTSYVSGGTSGLADLYTVDSSALTLAEVTAVRVTNVSKVPTQIAQGTAPMLKSGTTEFTKQYKFGEGDYTFKSVYYLQNEDTTSDWTAGDISSIQIGMEIE